MVAVWYKIICFDLSFHFQSTPKNISIPNHKQSQGRIHGGQSIQSAADADFSLPCVHSKVQQFGVVIANINADSDGVQSTAHEGIS